MWVSNRVLKYLSSKRDGAEETAEGETFRGENGQNPSSSQTGHIKQGSRSRKLQVSSLYDKMCSGSTHRERGKVSGSE